jgi:vacuolar protein sorting-associated protein VTA1
MEFVNGIFEHADGEDRAGEANMDTSHAFMTAFCLYEASEVFGELEDETKHKLQYARWKAADISKALKEGRRPKPGGADEDFGEIPDFLSGTGGGDDEESKVPTTSRPTPKPASNPVRSPSPPPASADDDHEVPSPAAASKPSVSAAPKPTKPASTASSKPSSKLSSDRSTAKYKGMGIKDLDRIQALISAEEQTRQALSSIRFNDIQAAIEALEQAQKSLQFL